MGLLRFASVERNHVNRTFTDLPLFIIQMGPHVAGG